MEKNNDILETIKLLKKQFSIAEKILFSDNKEELKRELCGIELEINKHHRTIIDVYLNDAGIFTCGYRDIDEKSFIKWINR